MIAFCKDMQSRAGLRDSGDFDELLPSYQPNATRPSEIPFTKVTANYFETPSLPTLRRCYLAALPSISEIPFLD
jgi:hypothetical protein